MAAKMYVSCLLLVFLLAIFLHVLYKPTEGFVDTNKASCDKKDIANELSKALGLPEVAKKDPETAALEKAAAKFNGKAA